MFSLIFTITNIFRTLVPVTRLVPTYSECFPSCLLSPIFSEHWSQSLGWCHFTVSIFSHVYYHQYFQNTGPSHSVGANVQRVFSLMFTITNIFRTLVPVTLLVPMYSGYFPSCLLSPIFSEHWSQSLGWCQRTASVFPHVYYYQYFQNTGPSHSVGANVQRVFSLMKNHNMALCSRTAHPINTCYQGSVSSSGSTSPTATELDLAEILLQLQDEFHQMSL